LTFIGGITSIVINYIALGALADFDGMFLTMYNQQDFMELREIANEAQQFKMENFMKPKIRVSYVNE
jgi:hypothetical protein